MQEPEEENQMSLNDETIENAVYDTGEEQPNQSSPLSKPTKVQITKMKKTANKYSQLTI